MIAKTRVLLAARTSQSGAWRWPLALGLAIGVGACGGGGGGPNNDTTPPLPDPQFRVTATSPFAAGCDGVPALGPPFINAEVAPMVLVDPRTPNHHVGLWP